VSAHQELIETARRTVGEVYALVHLAAVLRRQAELSDVTETDWDFQVDTNLKATFFLCRAAAEVMVEQGHGGRLVTFTSQGWWTGGFGGSVVYNTTKGGIVTMTRGLAPGQVRTAMLLKDLDPQVLEAMTQATPLGRIAEPEEIAGLAIFLASRHAGFITGATVNITGGLLMY
jgi:NAD(P)-dependent dehydrogenase (short-subunit alcohol dehydrogenase family)